MSTHAGAPSAYALIGCTTCGKSKKHAVAHALGARGLRPASKNKNSALVSTHKGACAGSAGLQTSVKQRFIRSCRHFTQARKHCAPSANALAFPPSDPHLMISIAIFPLFYAIQHPERPLSNQNCDPKNLPSRARNIIRSAAPSSLKHPFQR